MSHLLEWLLLKRQQITNVGEDMVKKTNCCGNWYSHYGKQYEGYSKNLELLYDPAILLLSIYPKNMKH